MIIRYSAKSNYRSVNNKCSVLRNSRSVNCNSCKIFGSRHVSSLIGYKELTLVFCIFYFGKKISVN